VRRLCLLQPDRITPSQEDVEVVGVFNPGAIRVDQDTVFLLARVAERSKTRKQDAELVFPRVAAGPGYRIESVVRPAAKYIKQDSRAYKTRDEGWLRLTTVSHLRLVKVQLEADGSFTLEPADEPTFYPEKDYEEYGIEDARITQVGDSYYITYVAVSRHGAATALARTRDFKNFEREGVIYPAENKDVVVFDGGDAPPHRILHRPQAAYPFGPIEMWFAESPDLVHWGRNLPLAGHYFQPDEERASQSPHPRLLRVGGGTPPVRYEGHWLEIYHAALATEADDHIGRYCAMALVLDSDRPHRIHRASSRVLFAAEEDFEKNGFVPDVVFPTGIVTTGDAYTIFYGAADENVGVAVISIQEIEESLTRPGAL